MPVDSTASVLAISSTLKELRVIIVFVVVFIVIIAIVSNNIKELRVVFVIIAIVSNNIKELRVVFVIIAVDSSKIKELHVVVFVIEREEPVRVADLATANGSAKGDEEQQSTANNGTVSVRWQPTGVGRWARQRGCCCR